MFRARKQTRRAASVVQVALVLAAVTAAVFVSVQFLGTTTNDDLDQTAGEVGDPASLVGRFGSGSNSGTNSGTNSEGDGGSGGDSGDSGGESDDWFR